MLKYKQQKNFMVGRRIIRIKKTFKKVYLQDAKKKKKSVAEEY